MFHCLPKDVDTGFFREVVEDLLDSYPDMSESEAEFMAESHDCMRMNMK